MYQGLPGFYESLNDSISNPMYKGIVGEVMGL